MRVGTLGERYLAIRSETLSMVLPLASVVMVTRILPLQAVAVDRPGILGMTRIRGRECPVLELAVLMGSAAAPEPTRQVVVRGDPGWVALAVEAVRGIITLASDRIADLPPLFEGMATRGLAAFARNDDGLYQVLEASRIVPPDLDEILSKAGDSGSGD